MKLKSIIIAAILIMISMQCYGQRHVHLKLLKESETKDFREIVQSVEYYYVGKDKGEGSGYREFKRWEHYHKNRLSPDGKVVNVTQTNFDEFYRNQESANASYANRKAVAGNWEPVGPFSYIPSGGETGGMGRVNCIAVDPDNSNTLYVGTAGGGLWRSLNSGATWLPLTDGIPRIGVCGIAIDPTSPVENRTIYILTGDKDGDDAQSIGVLRSVDGGETWRGMGLEAETLGKPHKIIHHPSEGIIYVGGEAGLFKYVIINETIERYHEITGEEVYDIEFKPGDASVVFASTSSHIYKYSDPGETWEPEFIAPANTIRIELAVTPAASHYVYAVCGSDGSLPAGQFNGLYKSVDSGDNYTEQSIAPNVLGEALGGGDTYDNSEYSLAITVSPNDPEMVHVGGKNCWRSTDGGATWGGVPTSYRLETVAGAGNYTHGDIHDLKYANTTDALYCASGGGIYRSIDNAENWENISDGLQISQVHRLGISAVIAPDTEAMIAYGAENNGHNVINPDDSNEHWVGNNGFEARFGQDNLLFGISAYGEAIYVRNYATINNPGEQGALLTPFSVNSSNKLVVGYENVWVKEPGELWDNISSGSSLDSDAEKITHLAVAPSDENYIYASKGNQIYRTTNATTLHNWTNITNDLPGDPGVTLPYFVIHPTDPDKVYVVIGGYIDGEKVYQTTDGGVNWTNISGSLPNYPINCIVYDESPLNTNNAMYAGMDIGVYYRDDDLGDWILFYHKLPNVEINELEINYSSNKLYAATYGRGIWQTELYGKQCEPIIDIPYDLGGFKYYTAENITASGTVEPFSQVNFVASNTVTLNNGFYVDPATSDSFKFIAEINPDVCSEPLSKSTELISIKGYYVGSLTNAIEIVTTSYSIDNIGEINVFPNPTNDLTYMEYVLKTEEEVTINIYDLNGKLMLSEERGIKRAGKHLDRIAIGGLQAGTYVLKLMSGQTKLQSKLIIKK